MDFYPGSDRDFANLPREVQVIWLAMEGHTDKTIAQLLEITTDTVATYWKRILVRYDSSSRTEVVAQFLREYFEGDLDQYELKVAELEEKIKAKAVAEQHQLLAAVQLNSLMNMLDVGVLFTNNALRVSYINEHLCRLAGCQLTPKEIIGCDISTFLKNCKIRTVKKEDSAIQRVKVMAASNVEKTVDQMAMTNGRILERTFCNVTRKNNVIGHFIVYRDVTQFIDENRDLARNGKLSELFFQRSLAHFEANADQQPQEIVNTLSAFAKVIGADHAIIAMADLKEGTFSVINSWAKNEFEAKVDYEQTIPLTFVEWFKRQLSERDYWHFDSLTKLPKYASMERSIFIEGNVKSAIAIRFLGSDPNKKYFVQFTSSRESFWDRGIIEPLMPLQRLLGTALMRPGKLESKSP